jgi:hypothetical protein
VAAPAHLLLSALADTALPKPSAEPAFDRPGPSADFHPDVYTAEGAGAEAPLTSEPPLPDAEPLTSEPPLAEAAPLTSETTADPDPHGAEL